MTASIIDELLNDECLRTMALAPSDRVLDVGSGFGAFTADIAAQVRAVVAVERDDAARRAAPQHERIDYRAGDARALPLDDEEWGQFDVAVARFVLESNREHGAIVAQMAAAVRPGGRVILIDDDHEALTLWPEAPAVADLWRSYLDAFDATGNDAIVGRRFSSLLYAAGLQPGRTRSLHFGASAGEAAFGPGVERLRSILTNEPNVASSEECTLALRELDEWSRLPDAVAWNVVRYAEASREST